MERNAIEGLHESCWAAERTLADAGECSCASKVAARTAWQAAVFAKRGLPLQEPSRGRRMADENAHPLESRIPLPDDLVKICRELVGPAVLANQANLPREGRRRPNVFGGKDHPGSKVNPATPGERVNLCSITAAKRRPRVLTRRSGNPNSPITAW